MSDGKIEITLTTERSELVDWLSCLPENRRAEAAEHALAVGFQVITYAQASATDETAARFFRPVIDGMGKLSNQLDTLMRYTEKSQRIGEMGEAIVAQQLKSAMPNDRFTVVSDEGHRGDVDAWFNLGDGVEERVIVEVKLYTNTVPSAEIEKFRSDLRTQRSKLGLMVSLTSKLTGVHGMFEIEATDDYIAVLLPEAGLDGARLALGASLLKALALYERRGGRRLDGEAIAQAWRRLQVHFDDLTTAVRQLSAIKNALRNAQSALNKTLDAQVDQTLAAETKLQMLVEQLGVRLQEELRDLKTVDNKPALPPPPNPDAVLQLVGALPSNDKRGPALRAICELCDRLGVDLSVEGANLVISRQGARLAETTGTATRVDVKWFVDAAAEVTIATDVEKYKDGVVTLEGKDVVRLVARLEARLANAGVLPSG